MTTPISIAKQEQTAAKSAITKLQNMDLSSTKPQTMVLAGMGVGAVLLSGMFITTIISGIFAIAVTGVAGIGGWFCLKNIKALEPAMRDKMRNKALEIMIKEAKKNSMQHLTNQVLQNTDETAEAGRALQKIQAMVMSLGDDLSKADPNRKSYVQKKKTYDAVAGAAVDMAQAYENVKAKNKEFEMEVEDHRSLAKFNDAAGDIAALIDQGNGKSLDDILNIEAFEAISDGFNESIVAIRHGAKQMGEG